MMTPSLAIPLFDDAQPNLQKILQTFTDQADWVGLRFVQENTHTRAVRNGRPEENQVTFDRGLMIEVLVDGHFGYAGTSNLSPQGLQKAFAQAKTLAQSGSRHKVFNFDKSVRPASKGHYRTPVFRTLDSESVKGLTDLMMNASQKLKASDKVVTALAMGRFVETRMEYISSSGAHTEQDFLLLASNFAATAQQGTESFTRTVNGSVARCVQMGLEAWDHDEILAQCERTGREALELLDAPNCPNDTRDLILAPDQMLLQIHESIGHPLELDRILGDERNYAGWSFVKPEDFGNLQYGSPMMNVTFDPTVPGEYASYGFDDCGNPAKREFLIEKGVLKRGLGSLESQTRSQIPGVANFRSSSWNRAPIDRMANINMEPGSSSLKEMIAQTEKGIYMEANNSWSIDDYRNKFQFGCEFARLIENGKLTKVVKNPNYRGITVPFWNSLKAVGGAPEVEIYGSPWCGKGEPSQVIRVGHSAPPCLFSQIEVFGGGQ
jgi:predicted Zn-dependent protease